MELVFLCLTALGLSMDAFAVSVTNGMCTRDIRGKDALKVGFYFGGFQGLMPVLGYLGGKTFAGYVQQFDHWIALFLLCIIGGKMVFEAAEEIRNPPICPISRALTHKQLLLQAVATSIDALAIGVGFAVMEVNIYYAAFIIASITFVCSVIGFFIGKTFGSLLKQKAEIFGGVILILLGIKIFAEHIFA